MPEQPALGLERGKTIIKAYDPRWASEGKNEVEMLRSVLGGTVVGLEHVGSTAVPGLASKPVLDIAAAYSEPSRLAEIHDALGTVGYVFHRDQGDEGGLVFIKGPESGRTHYLHVVALDSAQWRNYLAFRDALRGDSGLRGAYGAVKERLAQQFPADRVSYLEAKGRFIEEVLRNESA